MNSSTQRDDQLDNCFLLCFNQNDPTNPAEIHRLETNLLQDLCQGKLKKMNISREKTQRFYSQPFDFDRFLDSQNNFSKRTIQGGEDNFNKFDYFNDSETNRNRSKYQPESTPENDYARDRPQPASSRRQPDYNIVEHCDDELSVYEIYVPNNTLTRLSDRRTENNMVWIDYEDTTNSQPVRGPMTPYRAETIETNSFPYFYPNERNDFTNVVQSNYATGAYYAEGNGNIAQNPINNPRSPQQRSRIHYGNETDRNLYSPQTAPFLPNNQQFQHTDAINVRRRLYSPSKLPQGLTEGQLVMLLQKGQQCLPNASNLNNPPTILTPAAVPGDIQQTSTAAITVVHQPSPTTSPVLETMKTPVNPVTPNTKPTSSLSPVIDHRPIETEIRQPTLTATNTVKSYKDFETRSSLELKKDKSSDEKKDKKYDKDDKKDSKKDGKKEKSNGKDAKKKKK